jgi:hypothetical protein
MTTDQRTFNQKANAIREVLDIDVDKSDIDGLESKLLKLTVMVGLAAELKARAVTDKKTAELISYATHKHEKLQPSVFKIVIEGECAEEYGKLELSDRLCAGIAHSIDGIRTIISLRKEEMKNSTFQP